jgi:multiple sugar transport system substrate-binding protein
MRRLIADFERAHPDVQVASELLPNDSDIAHQYFLTALEAGADLDVFVVDIIWVQEFARAGWIADLSPAFSSETIRRDFISGAAEAVLSNGRVFAVPWYADVGVLYYRSDLVPSAPKTYAQLEQFADQARRKDPSLHGYLWQGRQYEGLVCNVFEEIWGHGGGTAGNDPLRIDTRPARAALAHLHSLLEKRLSPASVKSASEEDSRRLFQSGGAVFMRNWPYAWEEAQRPDSIIRGKVGLASLPALDGIGHGTLGGWQLAVNARAGPRHRDAAIQLIEHLTSVQSNRVLAREYGRHPPRRAFYQDMQFAEHSLSPVLYPLLESARARPATPYYNLLSDALQSEFSAAIVGVRSPEQALERAQRQIDRITGEIR